MRLHAHRNAETEQSSQHGLSPNRYSGEWEKTVHRLGRWIDFENDYKTLDPTFMESVWWAFAELYKKGLVYKGFKVRGFLSVVVLPEMQMTSGGGGDGSSGGGGGGGREAASAAIKK